MTNSNQNPPGFTNEFSDVKKAEEEYITRRRVDFKSEIKGFIKTIKKLYKSKSKNSEKDIDLNDGRIGLALSGGGIRSATFNLGLLQALAKNNYLRFCDYLSTVSGGGYIGSCLSSLLVNDDVSTERKKFPFRFEREKKDDERKEVKYLRKNSNFLIPEKHLFSLDRWRFIGLYLSGFVLTNFVTVSLVIFLTYFAHLIVKPVNNPEVVASYFLYSSLVFLVLLILTRWGAALRNVDYRGRKFRGYLQGAFALGAFIAAVLGGIILLAYNYLPRLDPLFKIAIENFLKNLFRGSAAAIVFGLLAGLLKTEQKIMQKFINIILRISWVALLPILIAGFVRFLWLHDAFGWEIFGIPVLIIIAIVLFLFSLFINTNRISMHYFYRDRLSEAYIIRREKVEEKVEEKDKDKDKEVIISDESILLTDLHKKDNGPYHIINTTLNIPGSENRYLRGRGADFFEFSKEYCGSESTGFRKTEKYNGGETRLATAMAISGAAASPQMGEMSSPILSFILTLLNVRLNRWMPNPQNAQKKWLKFFPYYFIKEMLGKGRENDYYLNLSDGGHHENLGIYPLIKRGCKIIIASDAGADPNFEFGDLAKLLRKVRIDLGVVIDIDLKKLRYKRNKKVASAHFAFGKIKYPKKKEGILIYIKSSVTGDEDEDLLAYRRKYPTFPDQTTADQFFDEAQFESYRQLGYRIGKEVFS